VSWYGSCAGAKIPTESSRNEGPITMPRSAIHGSWTIGRSVTRADRTLPESVAHSQGRKWKSWSRVSKQAGIGRRNDLRREYRLPGLHSALPGPSAWFPHEKTSLSTFRSPSPLGPLKSVGQNTKQRWPAGIETVGRTCAKGRRGVRNVEIASLEASEGPFGRWLSSGRRSRSRCRSILETKTVSDVFARQTGT